MSLDIYIISPEPIKKIGTGIFVRKNGQTVELTKEEAIEAFKDLDPDTITTISDETDEFWHGNITHNLGKMAEAVEAKPEDDTTYAIKLYDLLWGDVASIEDRYRTIQYLGCAIAELESYPEGYKQLNPENGWGTYETLVNFTKSFLKAVINAPEGSKIIRSK